MEFSPRSQALRGLRLRWKGFRALGVVEFGM